MNRLYKLLLVFVLAFCLVVSNAQNIINAQDTLPEPPGELIDVGGHQLHIYCMGEGNPTVILETGSGVLSLSWYPLQEQIAEFTRVCTYDRAGYGWSDLGPTPRTALQIATELETLMINTPIEPPVILVGHSMGGMMVRYFAATHPTLVAGVLLVDASTPNMIAIGKGEIPEFRALMQAEAANYDQLITHMRWSGELTSRQARGAVSPNLPEELVETYVQLMTQPKVIEAIYAEYVAFSYNLEQTDAAGDLGDIPLIVLAARNGPIGMIDSIWERWIDFQEEQSLISTNGRFEALDSGHYIYVELPNVVLEAIRELVEGAR